jgi:hypothetical protein
VGGSTNFYLNFVNFINCKNKEGKNAPMIDADAIGINYSKVIISDVYMVQCVSDVCVEGGEINSKRRIEVISFYYYDCTFGYLTSSSVSGSLTSLTTNTKYNLNDQPTPEMKCDLIISDYRYRYDQKSVTGIISDLPTLLRESLLFLFLFLFFFLFLHCHKQIFLVSHQNS